MRDTGHSRDGQELAQQLPRRPSWRVSCVFGLSLWTLQLWFESIGEVRKRLHEHSSYAQRGGEHGPM